MSIERTTPHVNGDDVVTLGWVDGSLDRLIDHLRRVPEGLLSCVGYVDAEGNIRALTANDLRAAK